MLVMMPLCFPQQLIVDKREHILKMIELVLAATAHVLDATMPGSI
jgi:hypothetical protein